MAYIGTSPSNGVRRRFVYEATASQTSFSGSDENGVTLTYVDSLYLDVYQNGIKLKAGDDYTATTGTTVVLVQGASANDVVEMVAFDVFSVGDTVSAKDGGSFAGNVAMAGTLGVTGDITLSNIAGGAVFNEAGADVDFRVESDTVDHALFVDGATGNVGIGVVPKSSWNSSWTALQLGATGFVGQFQASNTDVTGLGSNVWSDGAYKYIETDEAAIIKLQNGTMLFEVAASGSADAAISFTTAMKIHNNGVVSASAGVALGVWAANTASNVLDDYETGTANSTITGTGGGTVTTANDKTYRYTKVGNLVHFQVEFSVSGVGGVSGAIQVALPFASVDYVAGSLRAYAVTYSGNSLFCEASPSGTQCIVKSNSSGSATLNVLSTGYYFVTIQYMTS